RRFGRMHMVKCGPKQQGTAYPRQELSFHKQILNVTRPYLRAVSVRDEPWHPLDHRKLVYATKNLRSLSAQSPHQLKDDETVKSGRPPTALISPPGKLKTSEPGPARRHPWRKRLPNSGSLQCAGCRLRGTRLLEKQNACRTVDRYIRQR